ncbi:MAG: type I glyceraldehyde-3-phosphate dehydrogenase [Alphaproteobacteria bacterium GM202ARS2]|nr:type I glyceraldehyde-3-phosphate dehydrogenase [Alphaproteobacteria bacterium GM202ARS2]
MSVKVAINGFGRIGRLVFRAWLERQKTPFNIVAINDLGDAPSLVHLLRYDSVHGAVADELSLSGDTLTTSRGSVRFLQQGVASDLPWRDWGIDIVLECSGRFTSRDKASAHLAAGARAVLVSAPCTDADLTVVYGINHDTVTKDHQVVSNASCTTNCLVPVVHLLDQHFGFERGYMTTIHSYTGDQSPVDTWHKDLRRARAAALSMIPTTSGAARAVKLVLPHLDGKLDGCAVRVPTANVSLVDLTFTAEKSLTCEAMNDVMSQAAQSSLRGVLAYNDLPLVSVDFNHHAASSIFDATQTQVVDGRLGRVVAWYDNEWGFSNRMLDSAGVLAGVVT